jgi:putative phosphoesterase
VSRTTIRIGLIADTHGLFDPAIRRHFAGVNRIIHAGDIGNRGVIERLEDIAPVIAVSGNVDDYDRSGFPVEIVIELAGYRIAIRHIISQGGKLTREGRAFLEREKPDVCVFGHTHRPTIERIGEMVLINPGSAGPKRFTLPRGIGMLTLATAGVLPSLIRLHSPVAPRPSRRKSFAQKPAGVAL